MPEDNIQLPIGQLLGSGYAQGLLNNVYGAGLGGLMNGNNLINKFQQGVSQFQQPNSLVAPQDVNAVQQPQSYGASSELNKGGWGYGQQIGQPQSFEDKYNAMMQSQDEKQRNQRAMDIMAKGIQGMGRGMAMPSGNTAQIMRDQNQFRFPQQQMAQALRNRG